LNELARSLGLGGVGTSTLAGLGAGGDCPAATGDATAEIAAQASAVIPLKEGLTLSYLWTRTPQEEYECLIQVTKIAAAFIETSLSCNYPERGGPFIRRICRDDLRHARMLHTLYGAIKVIGPTGEEEPETITGATAFSLSTDEFARMKSSGVMAQHYVEFGPSGRLEKNGVGELHVDGREMMKVIVNNQPIEVPVIRASGKLAWRIRGESLETSDTAVILDDERLPLFIDQRSTHEITGSRIQFTKITYPSEANSAIEGGLLEAKRVDVYGIYFDFNSDRIRKESEPVLREIGAIMKKHPDWSLSIAGHTDNIGGAGDYNVQLSQRRSEAVKAALVGGLGIAADRLTTSGYGASSPIDTNETPEGRARNRRVELVRR
jgi:outer membrane protein OmpA-like peptidoglycan-associated protein